MKAGRWFFAFEQRGEGPRPADGRALSKRPIGVGWKSRPDLDRHTPSSQKGWLRTPAYMAGGSPRQVDEQAYDENGAPARSADHARDDS